MALSWTHRRALEVLAKAGPRGVTEALMLAHGFAADLLADLEIAGFAVVATETVRTGGPTTKVERFRITDAGRGTLEG